MSHLSAPAGIPVLSTIAPLASGKTCWLVDIWGVMHNGVSPFLSAADACGRFRGAGGTVLLLSNAPRPAASVVEQLDRIGVPRTAYDSILTSGDASRELIREAAASGRALGHLGPERDLGLFAGLGRDPVALDEAQTVICTGLFHDDVETPDHYAGLLERLSRNGADMICANPDLTVERGGRIIYCAGALAKAYEALGGTVAYAGKPYQPIYRLALDLLADLRGARVARADILAIGDGIHTDIEGAAEAGIASVYIASGVHLTAETPLDSATIEALFRTASGRPVAAMRQLSW